VSIGNSRSLPEYKNPPVDEVVCGILFEPLKQFLVPHFGLLWEKFKEEYPRCRHVDPLMPVVESATGPRPDEIVYEVPLPRIWFLHDDGRIIQVQRDRFLHNWRKLKPTDEYPRYRTVFKMFQNHFSTFQEFLSEHQLGEIIPKQYEMTYVNNIPQAEGWETVEDPQKVFPDFSWRSTKDRFLPNPAAINWQTSFGLPNTAGRLHMNIQSAVRIADKRRIFRLEITARGIGDYTSLKSMQDWFELAHEWIVRGFADYTSMPIQKNVWERIE
jgi:uncharacterized protein (TIGR04255 family)